MEKIKIALVDDHKIVRDGILSMLKSEDYIEVVAEASSKAELFEILKKNKIDILLLDVFLPKPINTELIKTITGSQYKTKIIILSGNTEEDLILGTFQAGADGYLPKNIEKEELIEAIISVFDNGQYLSKSLTANLSQNFIKKAKFGDKYAHSKLMCLSERETDIIRLFSDGLSYKEIASKLNISTRTVEAHKNNILEKLDLKNTIEIVRFAIKNNLVEL